MPSRLPHRFALVLLGALTIVAGCLPATAGASAADDLREAKRRANAAAAELSDAESALARASDAVVDARQRVGGAEAKVALSRDVLRDLAIEQYVGGGASTIRILAITDASELVRAQGYAQAVAGSRDDSLRRYRAEAEDFRIEVAALEAREDTEADALEGLRKRREAALAEVGRLARVVAEQQALAARQSAAAGANRPSPGASAGQGSTPTPATVAQSGGGGWVCPVHQPNAFSNDFGAPRAGGRSHQGNDILAPRGTPVVANVSGTVSRHPNNLGGLAYFLRGDDGSRYYGAHLDSYGAQGRVSAGTIIGYVGTTGDARGGPPHLHFEMQRPNGVTANPYQTLIQYC